MDKETSLTPQEKLDYLRALMNHEGFLLLNQAIQTQVDHDQQEILFPLGTMEDALKRNYVLGRMEGKLSWITTLEGMISSIEQNFVMKGDTNDE